MNLPQVKTESAPALRAAPKLTRDYKAAFIQILLGFGAAASIARLVALCGFVAAIDQLFGLRVADMFKSSPVLSSSLFLNTYLLMEGAVRLFTATWEHKIELNQADPRLAFADSALRFATYLKSLQKNETVLTLRDGLTRLFHFMGLHEHRVKLGQISLKAATDLGRPLSKAEVFLDDLGWAEHLRGNSQQAIGNVKLALDILGDYVPNAPEERVEKNLLYAKANRHLAMLSPSQIDQTNYLNEAKGALDALAVDPTTLHLRTDEVARDQAQLLHARAFITARQLGVERAGQISASAAQEIEQVKTAIVQARQAAKNFERIGDLERHTKVLFLLERLYAAIGEPARALETSALRDHLLRISGIDQGEHDIALIRSQKYE